MTGEQGDEWLERYDEERAYAALEQRTAIERLPPAIGNHSSSLAKTQPGGCQVVGRVIEDSAAPYPLEFGPHTVDLVDQARSHLDGSIQLTGDDPRHCERLRPLLESPPAYRRGVYQLAEHLDRCPGR